jgi:multiple sugar transport system substrate-binding protein
MKRIKTFLATLLALSMLFVMIAACAEETPDAPVDPPEPAPAPAPPPAPAPAPPPDDDDEEEEEEVEEVEEYVVPEADIILAWWGNPTRDEQTLQVVDLFNAEFPQVSITPQTQGWADYWGVLLTDAAGGALPTVIQQDVAQIPTFAANGHLLDLREFFDSGLIDVTNIPQSIINLGTIPGSDAVYALSIGLNAGAVIYDRDLLNSIGITLTYNMSIDDFINVARQVHEETGVTTNWSWTDPSNNLENMLRAEGIVMFEADGLGGTADDYVRFFEIIALGAEEGWLMTFANFDGREGMAEETVVFNDPDPARNSWMSIQWDNQLNGFQAAADDVADGKELGLTTVFSDNPTRSNLMRSSMYFSISTQSTREQQEAGAALINFWVNSIEANRIINAERGMFVSTVVSDALLAGAIPVIATRSDFIAFVEANSSPPNPLRPEGQALVVDLLRDIQQLVAIGQLSPQDAAERLFNEGTQFILDAQ